MNDFYAKLKEYLKMDSEISYEEFADFHKRFIDYLNINYQEIDRDTLLKGRYICTILKANSWDRSRRKDAFAKKFKKIMEKNQFWADAIKFRLQKEGMTAAEIDAAHKELGESD